MDAMQISKKYIISPYANKGEYQRPVQGKEHGEIDKRRRISETSSGERAGEIDKRRRISERG